MLVIAQSSVAVIVTRFLVEDTKRQPQTLLQRRAPVRLKSTACGYLAVSHFRSFSFFVANMATLSLGMDTEQECHEKLTGVLPWIAYADAQDATDR